MREIGRVRQIGTSEKLLRQTNYKVGFRQGRQAVFRLSVRRVRKDSGKYSRWGLKRPELLNPSSNECSHSLRWFGSWAVQRSGEEQRGFIKWLRPQYQIDKIGPLAHRADRVQTIATADRKARKPVFPSADRDQARLVLQCMEHASSASTARDIAAHFAKPEAVVGDVEAILRSLARLGLAEMEEGLYRVMR